MYMTVSTLILGSAHECNHNCMHLEFVQACKRISTEGSYKAKITVYALMLYVNLELYG